MSELKPPPDCEHCDSGTKKESDSHYVQYHRDNCPIWYVVLDEPGPGDRT